MCIVFFEYCDDYVRLAANREESVKRPATLPMHHHNGVMHGIIAGEDRGPKGDSEFIGTWLGMNRNGLVVAATNRDDGVLHGADKVKSRGLLCAELLGCETPADAASFAIGELEAGGYGGSNYVILHPSICLVIHAKGPKDVNVMQLHPNMLHVLTNADVNDENDARIKYIWDHYEPMCPFPEHAKRFCFDEKVLVYDDDWGTVSSTIIVMENEQLIFDHCQGKPTSLDDYKHYAYLIS